MSNPELARAVAAVLDGIPRSELADGSGLLSKRYRSPGPAGAVSDAEGLAYLATRLPATAEAMRRALAVAAALVPELAPLSQLDLGAGAGAAAWAAGAVWPSIDDVTLLERDGMMIDLGRRLAASDDGAGRRRGWKWRQASITGGVLPPADVVTAGYVLGELDPAEAVAVAGAAFAAARKLLVVLGPGTPAGFAQIRTIRAHLLDAGAAIVAPCPHDRRCPVEAPDWCHFAARVERSPLHRSLKGGRLGHEDEKFSYVAVAPDAARQPVEARVLRHPVVRRRLVELQLCCDDGRIRTVRVGKSKAAYRTARSLGWGESVGPGVAT